MSQPNDDNKEPSLNRITLAERFWKVVPPIGYPAAVQEPAHVVGHLLAILQSFRDLEVARDREATVATLSLLTLVRQQEMLGDLNYASPEQLRNEPLTECSLVFSVGVLLFERLCQRHPFSAEENPLRLVRMERAELGSGVNYFPFVPPTLRVVLQRALSSTPEDRPQTLAALADELTGFLHPKKRQRGSGPLRLPRTPVPAGSLSVGEKIGLLLTTDEKEIEKQIAKEIEKEVEMVAEPASPAESTARRDRRSSGWPLALAGAAAGVSLIVFVTWSRLHTDEPVAVAPTPTAAAPTPTAAPVAAVPTPVAPEPVAAVPAPVAPVAPAPVAAAAPAELPAPSPPPASQTFDPAAGGELALASVQECFSPYERSRAGFSFGLSLLFSPDTGRVSKVYFPNEAELDPAHVNCLSHVLRRVTAGGRPAGYIAVEYRFIVKGDALHVSVVGTNP